MGSIRVHGENISATIEDLEWGSGSENLPLNSDVSKTGEFLITISTNTNFEFLSVVATNEWGDGISPTFNDEKTVVTFNNFYIGSSDSFYIDIVVTEIQPPTTITGFNKLYLVNNENMIQLTKERFIYAGGSVDNPDVVDLADYIINILELPFSINTTFLGNETQIRLGNSLLEAKGIFITTDEMVITLGEIHVPKKYNNAYDYVNTVINLYLPFFNTIQLDIDYVIGETISIVYIIDLYSGDVTVNISSTRTNRIMLTETFQIGREIPFIRKTNNVFGAITSNAGVNNGINTPYIEVIRNKVYDVNNPYRSEIASYGVLKDVKGFISVSEIELKCEATTSEKEDILTKLKGGVFIK